MLSQIFTQDVQQHVQQHLNSEAITQLKSYDRNGELKDYAMILAKSFIEEHKNYSGTHTEKQVTKIADFIIKKVRKSDEKFDSVLRRMYLIT